MVVGSWFIVCNAPFNNISFISWQSVLLVEKTGVHGENLYYISRFPILEGRKEEQKMSFGFEIIH